MTPIKTNEFRYMVINDTMLVQQLVLYTQSDKWFNEIDKSWETIPMVDEKGNCLINPQIPLLNKSDLPSSYERIQTLAEQSLNYHFMAMPHEIDEALKEIVELCKGQLNSVEQVGEDGFSMGTLTHER
jgi:hypothetical protein